MGAGLARDRILAEAEDLFAVHGAGGVTMRGLASRMGVTPMALYRHYSNRDELLRAVVEEGHVTFLDYLRRSLAAPTAGERLVDSGRQFLAFALDHPRKYAVMFMEHVPARAGKAPPMHWADAETFRFLVDRIRECRESGDLDDARASAGIRSAEEIALTVWGHVHGLVSLFLAGKLGMDDEAFESLYLRSMVAMMRGHGWTGGDAPPRRKPR